MSHEIYQNDTQFRSWEVLLRDRNRIESKPTVSSGTYTLLDNSGNYIVPTTNVVVTAPNIVSFLIRPSSGSAVCGEYSEIWKVYIGSEDFTKQETLYINERF